MNQNEQNNDYNIVIDTLQKKLEALQEIQRGSDNSRRVVGGGVGMMDSIRYEQIDELTKAIEREKAFTHINETPKNEHDSGDVLKKSGNLDMMREALQLAVRQNEHDMLLTGEELRQCRQALAAEPAPDVFELNAQIAELKTSNAKLRRIAERGAEFEAQIIKAKAQLVPEIADAHRTLAKWLNEEIDAPVDRQALAKVLAATQCLAVKECVTAQPKKLVRLTDEQVFDAYIKSDLDVNVMVADLCSFAGEIMDEMELLNTSPTK